MPHPALLDQMIDMLYPLCTIHDSERPCVHCSDDMVDRWCQDRLDERNSPNG